MIHRFFYCTTKTSLEGQNFVTSLIDDPSQFQGKEKSWNESFFQQLGLLQDLGQNDFEKIGSTILRSSFTPLYIVKSDISKISFTCKS